jgi:putative transferase (TIGR04331 family)
VVSRFLVTTALEQTWPADDVPLLLLGEWCRLYERKTTWEKRDIQVTPYHWDDRVKLHRDYLYLQALYEELLGELAKTLNELHAVDHSIRYWRILAGPWLGYFVQILFDRWECLRHALAANDVAGVRVLSESRTPLVPNDMADFIRLFLSDEWNEAVYGQLLVAMGVQVEQISCVVERSGSLPYPVVSSTWQQARGIMTRFASRISGVFCRENESFFISSYLPLRLDLLLQLKSGQVPKVWRSVPVPATPIDNAMRRWGCALEDATDFAAVARAMLPRHIPRAYLEGYRSLVNVTESIPWPKRPKVIFTSNSYSADDTFKAWAAQKVESGAPLVIGQHGGNYGMALWSFTEEHQIAICDRFLTWGWTENKQDKVVPLGNLKDFGRRGAWKSNGVALLVETTVPRTSYCMFSAPVAGQWLDYFEQQALFISALPEALRAQVLVRLYSSDFGWSQKQRWEDRFPEVRLEEGSQSMESLVKESRLYISTYNATTYLESMSLNIPTILFWNEKYWEIRESAQPFFERLKAVGIFHESPESAALHMASIWNDVSSWWESETVQAVRKEFCDAYAHIPEKPLTVLSRLFNEISTHYN